MSINSGIDNSSRKFNFGNIVSDNKTNQVFTSADYRWFITETIVLQSGISHDFQSSKFNDSIPVYYYALSSEAPNFYANADIFNHILEVYSYLNWDIDDKWTFSSGMRSNIPVNNQMYYLSSQLGLKYRISKKQSFLFSGGKYHNYSTPNYYSKKFNLLKSYQLALDYSIEYNNTLLTAATYYKDEKGEQTYNSVFSVDNQSTYGIELFYEQRFRKYFKLTFSNTFMNQIIKIDDVNFKGEKDYNYFVKTSLNYNNPNSLSLTLSYLTRPGNYYTSITSSEFDNQTNFYQPQFSTDFYSRQYKAYKRIDFSLSRYFKFRETALIAFASLNNVLNTKNEREVLYNSDYTEAHFDNYQLRTIYFGLVFQLNY